MTSASGRKQGPGRAAPATAEANGPGPLLEPAPGAETWREDYPYGTRMTRREYEEAKRSLQIELLKLQSWVRQTGQRVVLLFEGRDAAGKGGTIKRFTEHLNPRGARVVALEKPSERAPSGTSSATSSTCRPPARSSCLTGPGITGRAWSG